MKVMTHDEAIDMIKSFFDVDHYDLANSILTSLIEAKNAHILPDTGRISMPELDEGLKEFFNDSFYRRIHE